MGPFRNPLLSLLFISLCIVSRIEGVRGLGNSSGCMRLRENFLEQVFLPLTVNYTSETQGMCQVDAKQSCMIAYGTCVRTNCLSLT